MTQDIAHFVFTLSGAGNLIRALRSSARKDQIVATCHDFHFGPIDPSDPSARTKWIEAELGRIDLNDEARSERVWDEGRFPGHRKVAWFTRRSTMEYAGFLDWLWHRGDTACDVIDLTEVELSYPPRDGPSGQRVLPSLALLHDNIIAHNKLWELARPLVPTERRRYRDLWGKLLCENAPLRVIEGDKLVSAPISFFDSTLMSFVTPKWQRAVTVFASVTVSHWDDEIWQTNETFLEARLRALIESGHVEIRGEAAAGMIRDEVRLPKGRPAQPPGQR